MNIFSVDNEKKILIQLKFMVIKLFTLDNFKHNICSQHSIKFYINKIKLLFYILVIIIILVITKIYMTLVKFINF